jgi:PAS domain S-box-containing protein
MGAGIAGMHYIGMDAMRLPAMCQFDSLVVVLSVVFALLISLVAIWITFYLRVNQTRIGRRKLAGAVAMGAAIPVMHYTGMAAASFTPSEMPVDLSYAVSISTLGATGIAAATLILLGLALVTSWADKRFTAQALQLQERKLQTSEAYLSEAQGLSHTGSFGWRVATGEITWSEETYRIFQYERSASPTIELVLQRAHPEDASRAREVIERASRDGLDFDFEHRLLMPDGSVKNVRIVAHASSAQSDSIEFVGAVMDITVTKQAEEIRAAQARQVAVRADVSAALSRATPSTETLRESAEAMVRHLGAAFARIWTLNEEQDMLELQASAGIYTHLDGRHSRIPFGKLKIGLIAQQKKPHLTNDVANDSRISDKTWAQREGIVSFAGYPLIVQDRVVGVMAMFARQELSRATLDTLALIADTVALGIERKQTEEKIRQSEAYLAEAQRLSHTGSFGLRVSSGELFWSHETYRILGVEQGTVPTIDLILQRTHPEDLVMLQAALDRAVKEGTDLDLEHRLLLPDGSVKFIHVVSHAIRDDSGRLEFVGAVSDVSERKRAELELRESERNLRMLVDAIPGMVGINSVEGSHEYSNQRLLDYTGRTIAEMVDLGWTSVFHPDDIERFLETWSRSVASGEPYESEFRLRRSDGVYRWFQCRSEPLRDAEGRIIRWYSLIYDVDDRRKAQEALRKTQFELAHVSRVMTMGELVASIAHEVNQPLGAIVTNGQACIRLLTRETPDLDKSREVISRMIAEGMRASEVIKRIRNLLHKAPSEKSSLDINEAIEEVIALVSSDVLSSKVDLQAGLAADLPPVAGDRIQLQQVILNLILNGKDAMSVLKIDKNDSRKLLITSRSNSAGDVLVAVRDSGPGLDPKNVDRMFEPFFTTKPGGMGLGLSISRTIIEAHGGALWASQNKDMGATLQFSLPSAQGENYDASRASGIRH